MSMKPLKVFGYVVPEKTIEHAKVMLASHDKFKFDELRELLGGAGVPTAYLGNDGVHRDLTHKVAEGVLRRWTVEGVLSTNTATRTYRIVKAKAKIPPRPDPKACKKGKVTKRKQGK